MSLRAPLLALVASAAMGCTTQPPPQDLSNAKPIPVRNTAAHVTNVHATTAVQDSPLALDVLAQPDRSERDRALDGPRQSADVLTFLGVAPGMRVAELGSGGGYMTELLARAVGPSGHVWADNPPSLLARAPIGAAFDARFGRSGGAFTNVLRVERELNSPLPKEARELDLVVLDVFYRDLPSLGADPRAVAAAAFDAVRPGGRFVVIDRAPPEGNARADLRTMHTEESRNARYAIERAGFRFAGEGRFLRDRAAPTDWDATPNAQPTALETQDRFFLAFVKP